LLASQVWVGYLGSDDATYARGAYGWLNDFPYVGGHGTIRYTITIPIALSFKVLGESSFALALPSLLYAAGFIVVTYMFLSRYISASRATAAAMLLVTTPLLVVQSTIAGVDVIELFFLFLSFTLYHRCASEGPTLRRLFAAGAFAGLAFLTRETAIFIAVFYGILFLIGFRFDRRYYLMIGVGFAAIWLLEVAYLTIMTGDPLYRFNISIDHDSTIDRTIDVAGNVLVHPYIDPLLTVLLNQEFMLLFWLGAPLAGWLCLRRDGTDEVRTMARLLSLLGITWFVCVGAAFTLLPLNARYFLVSAAAVALLTGLGLVELYSAGGVKRRISIGIGVALLSGNFAGLCVENTEHMFGEETLARLSVESKDSVIFTDPLTERRAKLLLAWAESGDRVRSVPAPPGALYFYNPVRTEKLNPLDSRDEQGQYSPEPDWVLERTILPERSILATVIETVGVSGLLPERLWTRLRYPHPGVSLYRIPPE